MASLNKVLLMGNLTRDPELRYAKSGTAMASFGLAVNTKSGEKEETLFIDVTAFGRQAETTSEYLKKGSSALIEGRLSFEQWESQDGQKRSKHKVLADRIQFMERAGQGEAAAPRENVKSHSPSRPSAPAPDDDNDDLPF